LDVEAISSLTIWSVLGSQNRTSAHSHHQHAAAVKLDHASILFDRGSIVSDAASIQLNRDAIP
jgi:hypothetical protein